MTSVAVRCRGKQQRDPWPRGCPAHEQRPAAALDDVLCEGQAGAGRAARGEPGAVVADFDRDELTQGLDGHDHGTGAVPDRVVDQHV